jgi:hypothetical protein
LKGRVQANTPAGVDARIKAMTVDVDTLKAGPGGQDRAATR